MKIYVGGTFGDQKDLRAEADRLWALGHEITSTWLQEVKRPSDMTEDTFRAKLAIKDMAEVKRADLLILDNRQKSGGKNVEWGIALGEHQHMQLWLVGESSNVFHELADRRFDNWDEVMYYLGKGKCDERDHLENVAGGSGLNSFKSPRDQGLEGSSAGAGCLVAFDLESWKRADVLAGGGGARCLREGTTGITRYDPTRGSI